MGIFDKRKTDPMGMPSQLNDQQLQQQIANDPMLQNDPLMQELKKLEQQTQGLDGMGGLDFKPSLMQRNYDENFLKFTLEIKYILGEIEHTLKSEIYNEETKTWQLKTNTLPLLNDYGVNKIIALLKAFLDKNTTLSSFDEEDISHTMTAVGRILSDTLYAEWEDFGLQEKEDPEEAQITTIDQIWEMITNAVYSALLRAKNGLTLKIVGQVYKSEEKGQLQQPQRRSFNPLIK